MPRGNVHFLRAVLLHVVHIAVTSWCGANSLAQWFSTVTAAKSIRASERWLVQQLVQSRGVFVCMTLCARSMGP